MKKILFISCFVLIGAWGLYYLNFGLKGVISSSTEVWGQFGDYVGGVVNPILSLITILLLINSLSEQINANKSMSAEMNRQAEVERFKKFESKFYNLLNLQNKEFESFFVYKKDEATGRVIELKGVIAATFISEQVYDMVAANSSRDAIIQEIDNWDEYDNLFSIARRFHLLVKLVDNELKGEEKKEYYELILNLSDVKMVVLVCLVVVFYEGERHEYILKSGILNQKGLDKYMKFLRGK